MPVVNINQTSGKASLIGMATGTLSESPTSMAEEVHGPQTSDEDIPQSHGMPQEGDKPNFPGLYSPTIVLSLYLRCFALVRSKPCNDSASTVIRSS